MMMWCDKNEFTSGFFSLLHVLYVLSTVFKEQNFMHNCLKFWLPQQKAEVAMRHFERVETTRSVKDLETEIIQKQKYVQEEEKK